MSTTTKAVSRMTRCRVWLEHNGNPVLGKGGAEILQAIKKEKSISKAAKKLGMSYRYAWNYLRNMRQILKEPVVKAVRGGKHGGGASLTEIGENLLREYKRVEIYVGGLLDDPEYWEAVGLKISARNQLEGTVQKVEKGVITAKVKMRIEKPIEVTAIISKEAVEELNIKAGDRVKAVIKATEVMISKNQT